MNKYIQINNIKFENTSSAAHSNNSKSKFGLLYQISIVISTPSATD